MANHDQNDRSASLSVIAPGIYSLLVDFGQPRSRSLGVPVGGAADRASLSIGNALVGNAPDAVALEISLAGPTLRADAELAAVLFGAPFQLETNLRPLVIGKTFTLGAGEELRIGGTSQGMRAYLCVRGGFHSPRILDSNAALEPLRAGDVLFCEAGRIGSHFIGKPFEEGEDRQVLRATLGAQAEWFKITDFYGSSFRVQPDSNRMGLRLQGPPLPVPDRQMISEPVCPGTVQVTSNGQCIILGRDGQTIGGYPKIAHVISADLDKLGQLRPGDSIRFELVEMDFAENACRERDRGLRNWVTRIRTAAHAV